MLLKEMEDDGFNNPRDIAFIRGEFLSRAANRERKHRFYNDDRGEGLEILKNRIEWYKYKEWEQAIKYKSFDTLHYVV